MEHFKYGSIGADTNHQGVPASLWYALPTVFADLLPKGPGKGYERLGFVYEPGHRRPIGTSYREKPIGFVGLNCAVCHTSTLRDSPTGAEKIVLGAPPVRFDLQGYLNFLRATGHDKRFNADTLIPAIKKADPSFSKADELLYRHYVIPRTKQALLKVEDDFRWMDVRPREGPGRVDTFNPYKVLLKIYNPKDKDVGTVDLPSLWNQRPRVGMHLHWDGNNTSLDERNISAAMGAGATEESLDEPSMARIKRWIMDLKPLPYPRRRIDAGLARTGAAIYRGSCATCHAFKGSQTGTVTPVDGVGTDRERLDSFTPLLARKMNTLGTGKPWRFSHFRKTHGYANQPLDGLWLRAPYLHNGSVPDLVSLLRPPAQRPKVFYRGYDVYDYRRVGYVSRGKRARRVGFRYDTRVRGNGNRGHLYGTDLAPGEKRALIEYLKTL
ncbi:MAG: cytochrome c [Actinomycetota bacterium]|nr:cytochrome c [Actinomycetota bacterium]